MGLLPEAMQERTPQRRTVKHRFVVAQKHQARKRDRKARLLRGLIDQVPHHMIRNGHSGKLFAASLLQLAKMKPSHPDLLDDHLDLASR